MNFHSECALLMVEEAMQNPEFPVPQDNTALQVIRDMFDTHKLYLCTCTLQQVYRVEFLNTIYTKICIVKSTTFLISISILDKILPYNFICIPAMKMNAYVSSNCRTVAYWNWVISQTQPAIPLTTAHPHFDPKILK